MSSATSSKPSSVNNKLVRPGIYEIQSSATSLFLNSFEDPVYNGRCDDALTLKKLPTRRGKWKLESVGDGYTIQQVISGLYCALADGDQFMFQSVVLSSVPTVWTIKHIDDGSDKVRIIWSVSDVAWEAYRSKDEYVLVINNLKPTGSSDSNIDEKFSARANFDWNMLPVEMPVANRGKIVPGLYSLKNNVGKTYVMVSPNGELGCWPKADFKDEDTKLWEISPWGEGYTIRLHGTDQYCTLATTDHGGDKWKRLPIHLSTFPATWRIVKNESAVHKSDNWFQIFWGNTQQSWDLNDFGKDTPGNRVSAKLCDDFHPCRLFRFIP